MFTIVQWTLFYLVRFEDCAYLDVRFMQPKQYDVCIMTSLPWMVHALADDVSVLQILSKYISLLRMLLVG